ncbi:lymphocyte antigen 6 complex, locus G6D, isoform CRA_c [Rattus norvegicus]|uniref:Lymphocyte antigen 6 complex, locus G6D, isoform CRA_c n=1 Tax=Rattus norvegicus TaxID=10116 RepID=A6KTS8_RAT|nr:lymphocyte antigen 6 complex, locus G6D, isoform CRA_c [Rattus norvegicus]
MRCYDCGGGPSNSCKQTVITCGEGERCGFLDRKPQPSSEQAKQRESLVVHPSPFPLLLTSPLFNPTASTLPGSVWLWADGATVVAGQSNAPGSWRWALRRLSHPVFTPPTVPIGPDERRSCLLRSETKC